MRTTWSFDTVCVLFEELLGNSVFTIHPPSHYGSNLAVGFCNQRNSLVYAYHSVPVAAKPPELCDF